MKATTRRLFLKRGVTRSVATAAFLLSPRIESIVRLPFAFARADNREIGKLIQQLGHSDDGIREKAFWKLRKKLSKIGKKIVPALMRGLRSKNKRMGEGCAVLLGSVGSHLDDKEINTIRKLLTKGKKHEQEAALIVMKNYSDVGFLPALLHATEKSSLGKEACMIVVVHYTVDQLIDGLKHKEKDIRRSVAIALKLGVQRPSIHCPHVTIHPASSNSKPPHYLHSTDVLVFSKAIPALNKIIEDANENSSVQAAAVDAKLAIDKEIEKAIAPEVYLITE